MRDNFLKNYPLTSKFLETNFSEISELYFKNFPEEEDGFYLPVLLKANHRKFGIPEFVFELADFENSTQNLLNGNVDIQRILESMQPGDVQLNPAHSVHRFRHDILSFLKKVTSENPTPKPNVTFIAKNPATSQLTFLKGSPSTACIVDYLAEGNMNMRILSAQLQRNFPLLFESNDDVLKSLDKLKKKYIVLQK